jgi:hypothetical protein
VAPAPPPVQAAVVAPAAPVVEAASAPEVPSRPAAAPAREHAAVDEAPWGRVENGAAIATAEPAALPQVATREPLPRALPPTRAPIYTDDAGPRREAALRPSRQEAPAAPREQRAAVESSGGSQVEVMSIGYAADVSARTASLRISGQPVTLHQGDSARGIEVQLILPHSVYLRRGRDIFAVDARR